MICQGNIPFISLELYNEVILAIVLNIVHLFVVDMFAVLVICPAAEDVGKVNALNFAWPLRYIQFGLWFLPSSLSLYTFDLIIYLVS